MISLKSKPREREMRTLAAITFFLTLAMAAPAFGQAAPGEYRFEDEEEIIVTAWRRPFQIDPEDEWGATRERVETYVDRSGAFPVVTYTRPIGRLGPVEFSGDVVAVPPTTVDYGPDERTHRMPDLTARLRF